MTHPETNDLKDAVVLVTRPRHQQQLFLQLLQQQGARAVSLPCLEIVSIAGRTADKLEQLEDMDAIVFTSLNAVNCAVAAKAMPWSTGTTALFAVGPKTAGRLAELGMPVTQDPREPYDTEALLSVLRPQTKNLQKVAIIKGAGGRTELASALAKTGVSVQLIDVYRRIRPAYTEDELQAVFLDSGPDIISVTSNESLLNLVALAGSRFGKQLLKLPLVVNSKTWRQAGK